MKRIIKVDREVYEQLRELGSFEDRSPSSMGNEILKVWLDSNFERIVGMSDECEDDEENENEDWEDEEEDWEDED